VETKRKILFINHTSGSGGAEKSLASLAASLSQNLAVRVALPSRGPLYDILCHSGIPVDIFRYRPLRRSPLYGISNMLYNSCVSVPALKKIIQNNQINIVHANNAAAQLVAGPAAYSCRIPSVWHCRDMRRMGAERCLLRLYSKKIIAVSNAVQNFLLNNGFPDDNIEAVYNGINPEQFRAMPRRGNFRAVTNIPADSFVALMAANFAPWKRHDVFLRTIPSVISQIPGARFVIAGDDIYRNNPSYYTSLQKLVLDLNISGSVLFTGNVPDIRPLLSDADCLVHPAENEPFGRIIVEAMASGLPVIASDNGGPAEIIENGRSGLLIPYGNINAFAEAIIKLAKDRQFSSNMGSAAGQRAAVFTIDKTTEKMERIYDSLLS